MVMDTNEKRVILFPKGIPGFEEQKNFEFFQEEENMPLAELNSVNQEDIKFIILRPQFFFPDYLRQVDLNHEEIELLEVTGDDQVDVWAIMTLSLSNMANSTVNLRAPLLINVRANKGLQIILDEESYSSRQRLLTDSDSTEEESTREGAVG